MTDYTINPAGFWRLYASIFPKGSTVLGTVCRGAGDTGVLVRFQSGIYAQVNAGVIRTLDQRGVREALGAHEQK